MHNISSPRNDDAAIEEVLAEQSDAQRVTLKDIEANILSEHYFTAWHGRIGAVHKDVYVMKDNSAAGLVDTLPLKLLTFCVFVLRNGFTVTGESACVNPGNFDAEIGRRVARENAVQKMWPLMGYALKEAVSK
jgi:hypothetical protein